MTNTRRPTIRAVLTAVPVSAREAVGMGKILLSWFGDVNMAAETIPTTIERKITLALEIRGGRKSLPKDDKVARRGMITIHHRLPHTIQTRHIKMRSPRKP